MKLWLEQLPRRFRLIETFNHNFPVKHSHPGFRATIEIEAGPPERYQLTLEGCEPIRGRL